MEKIQAPSTDELPPPVKARIGCRRRFKDFNDYDEVTNNIAMVLVGLDPNTKVFTEPAIAIKEEIQEITANEDLPAADKKQMLDELNDALKFAPPIQFPNNIELVRKHYEEIDEALK